MNPPKRNDSPHGWPQHTATNDIAAMLMHALALHLPVVPACRGAAR